MSRENWGLLVIFAASALRVITESTMAFYEKDKLWRIPRFFIHWKRRFLKYHQDVDPTGLAQGIFLGEDKNLSFAQEELFRSAGLAHVLAASGYNCMIVGALFSIPILLLARKRPKLYLMLQPLCWSLGASLFWLWSDQSPPVSRAASFVLMKSFLYLLGIQGPFIRLVMIQYVCSLLVWPSLFKQPGFQLSYACLGGMALGLKVGMLCQRQLNTLPLSFVLKPICGYFCTTTGAILAASPLTWYYFAEINFNGLHTNLITGPIVNAVIMPVGLIIMGIGYFDSLFSHLSLLENVAIQLAEINGQTCQLLSTVIAKWMFYAPNLRYAPYQ
jgi:ComEC/Rec2-related protein